MYSRCWYNCPVTEHHVFALWWKLLFTISVFKDHLIFMTEIPCKDDFVQKSLCVEWLPAEEKRTWPATPNHCTHRTIHLVYEVNYEWQRWTKLWMTNYEWQTIHLVYEVNYEWQRCKISVYTAANALQLFRKWLPLLILRREKVLTLA